MKIEELLCLGNKTVHKDQTKLLLAVLLNMNPLELSLHLNEIVDIEIETKFKELLESLEKGEPLQYALKNTNFYGLDFYVDKRVLIPRFETEELVSNTNNYLNKNFSNNIKVLDLCSGSGCIGLTLKYLNKNLDVTLSDISIDALEVARINQERLGLDVKIIESDLFQNIHDKYDLIIANPPYISYQDEKIERLVFDNEPHLALFADNNGLEFYDKILSRCENYLNDKYLIAFEIGYNQEDDVVNLANKYLENIKIITKKDMEGKPRMVFIFKNIEINE